MVSLVQDARREQNEKRSRTVKVAVKRNPRPRCMDILISRQGQPWDCCGTLLFVRSSILLFGGIAHAPVDQEIRLSLSCENAFVKKCVKNPAHPEDVLDSLTIISRKKSFLESCRKRKGSDL